MSRVGRFPRTAVASSTTSRPTCQRLPNSLRNLRESLGRKTGATGPVYGSTSVSSILTSKLISAPQLRLVVRTTRAPVRGWQADEKPLF